MNVPLDEQKLWHGEQVECLAFNVGSFRDGGNFILHNACWNILKAYFSSAPIPLDVVVNTLKLHSKEMIILGSGDVSFFVIVDNVQRVDFLLEANSD